MFNSSTWRVFAALVLASALLLSSCVVALGHGPVGLAKAPSPLSSLLLPPSASAQGPGTVEGILYCSLSSTAAALHRLNGGARSCDPSSPSSTQCPGSAVCAAVPNCTLWLCDAASQALTQASCTALCLPRFRGITPAHLPYDGTRVAAAAAEATVRGAADESADEVRVRGGGQRWRSRRLLSGSGEWSNGTGSTPSGAEVHLVLSGDAATAAAAGYIISTVYEPFANVSGLKTVLSSTLPADVTLLSGGGIATVTWTAATSPSSAGSGAAVVPLSLDGVASYWELRIPAPGLDPHRAFGCMSYNATSRTVHSAAGNISSVVSSSATAAAASASYDSSSGKVMCRLTRVAGSFFVAQQQLQKQQQNQLQAQGVVSTGGAAGSSNSSSGGGGDRDGAVRGSHGPQRSALQVIIVPSVVGGIMAVPILCVALAVCIVRVQKWLDPHSLQTEGPHHHQFYQSPQLPPQQQGTEQRSSSMSFSAVHPVKGDAVA